MQQPLRGVWTFHGYLQSRLLGLAQVAIVDRSGATRLEGFLGRERTVGMPGIRVYWPGFTRSTPPCECPIYGITELIRLVQEPDPQPDKPLLNTIDKSLHHQFRSLSGECFREGHLIRAARAALAVEAVAKERMIASLTIRVTKAETEADEARQARERLRRERDTIQRELDTACRELVDVRAELLAGREQSPKKDDEFAAELERVWDENDRLRVEIEAGRRRVTNLEANLRAAQENLTRQWQLPAEELPTLPVDERAFATVADALLTAATEFADVLTVWEDAERSAEESSFASPAQVYRALVAITEVGRDYFSARSGGPSPGPLDRAFQRRVPFKYAGFESQTTLSMYGEDRVFRHGGRSRQMQRHLTLGGGDTNNCLQIYFEFDDAAQRVLIGYCGKHLPYAGQRT